jgi:hypothetical protein
MPTVWRPDTCECVIEFEGSEPDDTSSRKIQLCPRHRTQPHTAVSRILAENRTKNIVALEIKTATGMDATSPDMWKVHDDGTVEFSIPDITDNQIAMINARITNKIPGRARITKKVITNVI